MSLIDGPREPRTNADARARIPMNAANVRWVIDQMMAVKGRGKIERIRSMANNAIRIGNVADGGKAVWREWLSRNPG